MTIIKHINQTVIILLILAACAPQANLTKVYHINDAGTITNNAIIYAIPKTTIFTDVIATKHTFIKGPFSDYAEKLLYIHDVKKKDEVYWSIDNIDISTCNDIDPDNLYITENPTDELLKFLQFNQEGFFIDIYNNYNDKKCIYTNFMFDTIIKNPVFLDLTVKRHEAEKYDTIYRKILRDSTFYRVPLIKPVIETKDLETKAEEAAAFIIKLRKRRFKLLSGQYEFYPDGDAIKYAIEELNKLEKEYLSLFIGKWTKNSASYTFEYVPEELIKIDSKILFKFSENDGILPLNSYKGDPVFLILNKLDYTKKMQEFIDRQLIDDFTNEDSESNTNKIYYRIPERAEARIKIGNNTLIRKKILVNQYGKILTIPVELFYKP